MIVVVVPPHRRESVFTRDVDSGLVARFHKFRHAVGSQSLIAEQLIPGAQLPGDTIDHFKLGCLRGVRLPHTLFVFHEEHLVLEHLLDGEQTRFGPVKVEIAIAIIVRKRRHGGRPQTRISPAEESSFEGAVALVEVEFVVGTFIADVEIQPSVVVEVSEGRARAPRLRVPDSGCFCSIDKAPRGDLEIKPVGSVLRDEEEVRQAVCVHIADCQTCTGQEVVLYVFLVELVVKLDAGRFRSELLKMRRTIPRVGNDRRQEGFLQPDGCLFPSRG